jgi:phosphatidylinositol glycan class S
LYIPSKSTTPLHILHSDASILSTNAFLIPQWGGITIYNLKNDGMLDIADMEGIMRVFAEQVRVLMGVSEIKVEVY